MRAALSLIMLDLWWICRIRILKLFMSNVNKVFNRTVRRNLRFYKKSLGLERPSRIGFLGDRLWSVNVHLNLIIKVTKKQSLLRKLILGRALIKSYSDFKLFLSLI